ncbi:hypothetical protein [Dyella sp. Tek66A03]|uniref:hypothetical protein n=1 Tax=Dyella sp. Tek66A03 TaxID=3458298 RepID=UPI00403E72BA
MNTHDHHDDTSLPGEDELQALYRSLPRREPSPALDQAVRQAAAKAIRPQARKRLAGWPVAFTSAAVLVLAVGLGLRMREQSPRLQAPPPAADAINANPPVKTPLPMSATNAPLAQTSGSAAPSVAEAPPAEIPRVLRRTHSSAKPLAKSPAATSAMADQAFTPPPPAPAPEIALAQAPPPLASAPPTAGYRSEPAARSMAMKTMASPMPAAAAPASPPAVDAAAANPNDTPAQELDKIRLLFVQHRRDEALQRLAAFRQAHPDMHLPDDLRAQLPDHD